MLPNVYPCEIVCPWLQPSNYFHFKEANFILGFHISKHQPIVCYCHTQPPNLKKTSTLSRTCFQGAPFVLILLIMHYQKMLSVTLYMLTTHLFMNLRDSRMIVLLFHRFPLAATFCINTYRYQALQTIDSSFSFQSILLSSIYQPWAIPEKI